jgi:hypothetical protein
VRKTSSLSNPAAGRVQSSPETVRVGKGLDGAGWFMALMLIALVYGLALSAFGGEVDSSAPTVRPVPVAVHAPELGVSNGGP